MQCGIRRHWKSRQAQDQRRRERTAPHRAESAGGAVARGVSELVSAQFSDRMRIVAVLQRQVDAGSPRLRLRASTNSSRLGPRWSWRPRGRKLCRRPPLRSSARGSRWCVRRSVRWPTRPLGMKSSGQPARGAGSGDRAERGCGCASISCGPRGSTAWSGSKSSSANLPASCSPRRRPPRWLNRGWCSPDRPAQPRSHIPAR